MVEELSTAPELARDESGFGDHSPGMETWLNTWGLVAAGDHRPQRNRLRRAVKAGELVPVLPGVFVPASVELTWQHRVGALVTKHPDVLITHEAAAALTWWPQLVPSDITCVGASSQVDWLRRSQRSLGMDWTTVREGVTVPLADVTALDLTEELGGEAIDEALRRRAVSVGSLQSALKVYRGARGAREKQFLVHDSRDAPWSELEREGHRELRRAKIVGWRANCETWIRGERFFLDAGFRSRRWCVEFDGFEWHSTPAQMAEDLHRQNALVKAGWTVLRYGWRNLHEMVPDLRALGAHRD